MEWSIRVLVTFSVTTFGIIIPVNLARAEEIPFEFHTPYQEGVEVTAGGTGNYFGDAGSDHVGHSYYCVDLNAPDNSGYSVTATAGGTVVAVGNNNSYHTYYPYDVAIKHEGGYYSTYVHLRSSSVSVGDEVRPGQVIGQEGSEGKSTGSHLHFCIFNSSGNSVMPSPMDDVELEDDSTSLETGYISGYQITSKNREVSEATSTAIKAKADQLWAIRPSGSGVSCEEYASSGLVCHEAENMHWWAGLSDSFVIETWTDGTKGEVDLTFDPDNTDQDRAYVVWGGFRELFHQDGHPDEYGPPIGDELDSTFDEYTGYDRYCDWDIGDKDGQVDSRERDNCIQVFCGSLSTYTSVQRFKDATLCWNADTWEAECDPKWPNEHCHEASGLASTPTPLEDDLLVYGSTIYWVQGGSTHGIVSAEMFEACGFSWSDPYPVTEDTFNLLPQGSLLDDPTDCGAVVDGTLVTQNSTVYEYWSSDASWHGYPSDLVFDACLNDWSSIQEMSSSVFNTITIGSVVDSSFECGMTYPGLLLSWNGTVYRITETGLKRGFTSSDVFSACGYDWNDVWALALDDYPVVTTLQDGSAISSTSDCANITGDLVHWEWTGTIYYLTGTGYKRGITSTEAMTSCGFDWNQVRYVTNANGAVVWTLGDAANITGNGDCP